MRWAAAIGVDSITSNQLTQLQTVIAENPTMDTGGPRKMKLEDIDLDRAMVIARDLGKWAILVASNMDNAMGNIDGLASQVHDQWLSRNSWAKDGPLGVPYSELPEEEKQKDRDVITAAHEILSEMMSGEEEEMPEDMESKNPIEDPIED
jgi:hypothetical protein